MKWFALLALVVLQCSCTTLANRRDLYRPEPAPVSREYAKEMAPTKTAATTTQAAPEEAAPPVGFR